MKKLFLISSTAGASEYRFSKQNIEDVYRKYNRLDEIIVKETLYKGHLEEIVSNFIDTPFDNKIIIVLGGDGSLSEVANLCYGSDIAIGLIPTGTGNDFAKNFNYKFFRIEDTFDIELRKIDLIRINDMYSVNVTSLGFDTEVLERAYEYLSYDKSLGKRAYIKAVRDKLKKLSYQDLDITLRLTDGRDIKLKDKYLISAICNGAFYGSGFNPAPDARIDDGVLNIVLCRKFPRALLIPTVLRYKTGTHQSFRYIDEYYVTSGVIKANREFIANNDGEIFKDSKIEFEVIPSAINWAYFK